MLVQVQVDIDEEQWNKDKARFSYRIETINSKIRKLNFEVPSLQMQRVPLKCDSFLERVTGEIDALPPNTTQDIIQDTSPTDHERGHQMVTENDQSTLSQQKYTMPTTLAYKVVRWLYSVFQRFP